MGKKLVGLVAAAAAATVALSGTPAAYAATGANACDFNSGVCVFKNALNGQTNYSAKFGSSLDQYSQYNYYLSTYSVHDSVSAMINYAACTEKFYINSFYTDPSGVNPFPLSSGYEASNLAGTQYQDKLDSHKCA